MVGNLDRGWCAKLAHSFVSIAFFLRLEHKGPAFGAYGKTPDRNISYATDIRIKRGTKGKKETDLYRELVISEQSAPRQYPF